ncbi:MAG: hypothetical protein IPG55_10750 [Saprospiraceae bacterium]|nr:hypothetical protein [Candidatus Defluviibacterium haderslevense]
MNQDHVSIWNRILELVQQSVEQKHYNTWFIPIRPIQLDGLVLTLEVPNEFFLAHLESNYLDILKDSLRSVLGQRAKIEYRILVDNYKNRVE